MDKRKFFKTLTGVAACAAFVPASLLLTKPLQRNSKEWWKQKFNTETQSARSRPEYPVQFSTTEFFQLHGLHTNHQIDNITKSGCYMIYRWCGAPWHSLTICGTPIQLKV